jgi:hypothetical protein
MPASLQAHGDVFRIEGRVNLFQHTVKFGPYVGRDVWEGPYRSETTQSPKLANDQVERVVHRQKVSFDFSAPSGERFRGACRREETVVTQYFRGGLFGQGKETQPPQQLERARRSGCTLTRPNNRQIEIMTEGHGTGDIFGASDSLSFSPLALGGSPFTPAEGLGYTVELRSTSIAAVDLSGAEAITLDRELPPALRDEVAAICMALYVSAALQ